MDRADPLETAGLYKFRNATLFRDYSGGLMHLIFYLGGRYPAAFFCLAGHPF